MKNKITDLNNHLFAQLERLGEEDLSQEDLQKEIDRSKAITSVANSIIESNKNLIDAMKLFEKSGEPGSALKLGEGTLYNKE